MSAAPAGPEPSTVPRPTKTSDPDSSPARDTSVISLADLVGRPASVTFSAPSDLGPCEDCVGVHSIAVATITWPDPHERTGHGEITVCRDCLGHQITALIAELADADAIEVEVPVWDFDDLEGALDLPDWMGRVVNGVPAVFLHAEDGERFLADEVEHARRLISLHRAGMTLTLANAFLRRDPDLARSVEAAVARLRSAA